MLASQNISSTKNKNYIYIEDRPFHIFNCFFETHELVNYSVVVRGREPIHWKKETLEIVTWVKEKYIVHPRHSGPCAEDPSTKEVTIYRKKWNCKHNYNSVRWTVIGTCTGPCHSEDMTVSSEDVEVASSEKPSEDRWNLITEGKYSQGTLRGLYAQW